VKKIFDSNALLIASTDAHRTPTSILLTRERGRCRARGSVRDGGGRRVDFPLRLAEFILWPRFARTGGSALPPLVGEEERECAPDWPRYFTSTGTPGSCLLERMTSAVFTLATFFAAVSVSVMKDWKAERFSATHLSR
jgi:hypothetical protein